MWCSCSIIQYNVVWCSIMQYNVVWCSIV
ncbi:hypothetical protein QTP70_026026 [Hemibagrus guttatus]|uniref:Uncharacterized protein n=1 Tax=Hemibagrus guttatus TaxID=175788 RepID=A0AAE0UQR0_9TELE|nr:hypothetical protein QTP70_026026 [Hemibagrus guttatus]